MELIRNGIIHRDLKPANILINQATYKLAGLTYCAHICFFLDFGLSKCVENFKNEML